MKQLILGKINSKELADWFGISYQGFRNKKREKLRELEDYAEFREVYGGVIIDKIKNPDIIEYSKALSSSKGIIYDAFDQEWNNEGLDTCANVAIKIYDKHKNELTINPSTTYYYTIAARNELYGKPFLKSGKFGNCYYLWVKVASQRNGIKQLELLTPEEEEIKKELLKKYFSTDEEKEIMIAEMVERKEITKEEAYDALCELKHLNAGGFMAFKAELEAKIGAQVLKGTVIEKKPALDTEHNYNWDF